MQKYKIHTYRTIENVPQEVWDSIAPQEYLGIETSHLKAIEQSGINDLEHYYLLASNSDKPVGVAYFFIMDFDISKLSSEISPETLSTLKFWNPNFMNFKMLECGLISGLGEAIAAEDEILPSILPSVVSEMESIGKQAGADFILIRDIPYHRYQLYKPLEEEGFIPVPRFPTATMELRWNTFEDYLTSLKQRTRRNIRKRMLKLNSPEIAVELIQDFGKYSDCLEYLWNQVSQRAAAEYEHEKLTASYFQEINQCLPDKSHIIAIRRKGEIIAFVLCLVGGQEYFVPCIGVDYQYNNQYGLYFNLHFLAIQEAIKRGKKIINFGVTTYYFKLFIGSELQPSTYFVKHIAQPRFTPALADLLRKSIKQPENIHRPFKDQDISKRTQLQDISAELDASRDKKSCDVFNKARSYVRADILKLIGLYSFFPPFESAQEAVIQFNGKPVVMLGTNSYLGLGTHPELRAAAKSAIDKYGTGCSGSPILNGTLDIHIDLAEALARFMQKEDAILFSTGYQTNLGIISAIAGRNDIVITDKLNHASLIDGARLSRGISGSEIICYKYNDMESLEKALQRFPGKAKLVVVDSIFSMEGTMANLPAIVELVKQYDARLMLDEAHAIGVIGPGGRGVAEYFGLLHQVDLIMGTFSKSFAAVGGFVAGDAKIIDYLRHVSRPHMFSASLPPPVVATVKKALDIIMQEPERRKKVLENAKFMAEGLRELGYTTQFLGTAIVPVHCGDELLTLALYKKLLEEGVFVNPVLSPAVPKGQERLRTSYMATHNEEMLTYALSIFAKVRTPTFPQNT